jgi:hypothetical protein
MILKAVWNIGKEPHQKYSNDSYGVDPSKAITHNGMSIVHDGIGGYFVYADGMIFTNRVGLNSCKAWIDDFQKAGGVNEYFSRINNLNKDETPSTIKYDMVGHW